MYRTISLYLNSRIIDLREKLCRTVPVYNNLPFIVARSLFGLRVVSALTHPILRSAFHHKLCKSLVGKGHGIKHLHQAKNPGRSSKNVRECPCSLTRVKIKPGSTVIILLITFSISITTDVKALTLPIFISSTFQIQ